MTFKKYCTICNEWYAGETCTICEQKSKTVKAEKPEKTAKTRKPAKAKHNYQHVSNVEDKKTDEEKLKQLIKKYNNG